MNIVNFAARPDGEKVTLGQTSSSLYTIYFDVLVYVCGEILSYRTRRKKVMSGLTGRHTQVDEPD